MPIRRGSNHTNAKLNEQQVREIRKKYQWFKVTQKQLAVEYHVSQRTIQCVLDRIYWKWLTDDDHAEIINDSK